MTMRSGGRNAAEVMWWGFLGSALQTFRLSFGSLLERCPEATL